ncbi:MAG: TonB-dependent receptor [Bacteroidales bacterium]|nr:TonB-dependent receptor [Bacteroidales bacterium]
MGKRWFRAKKLFFEKEDIYQYVPPTTTWAEFSSFAENSYTLNKFLVVSAGLRFDKAFLHEVEGNALNNLSKISPRLTLVYTHGKNANFKTSYQEGFHYPEAGHYGLVSARNQGVINAGIKPTGKKLEPEFVKSIELCYQQLFFNNTIQVNVNAYGNRFYKTLTYVQASPGDQYFGYTAEEIDLISDTLGFDFGSLVNLFNQTDIIGGELTAKFWPGKKANLEASYSIASSAHELLTYPSQIVKCNATAFFLKNKLSVNLTGLFYTKPKSSFEFDEIYNKPFAKINTALVYKVTNNLGMRFVVLNLLRQKTPLWHPCTTRPMEA